MILDGDSIAGDAKVYPNKEAMQLDRLKKKTRALMEAGQGLLNTFPCDIQTPETKAIESALLKIKVGIDV